MKKLFAIVLCVTLALVAVACVATASPSEPPVDDPTSLPATPDVNNPPVAPAEPGDDAAGNEACYPAKLPTPTVREGHLTVADASVYRGTVTRWYSGSDKDGMPIIQLEVKQAEGTNFGAPELEFAIGNDSGISFPAEQLVELEGKYIEIYYSYNTRNAPDMDELYDAIQVNLYGEEGMYSFNGIVAEIVPSADKEGEGRLLMTDMASEDGFQTYYLYGPETQMYLNFDEIKVGDKLNIFHSPATTMSLPPQCAAWEIRSYSDGAVKCPVE